MFGDYNSDSKGMKKVNAIRSNEYEISTRTDLYQLFYGVSESEEVEPEEDELSGQVCGALWKCSFLLFAAAVGIILLFLI